jgi:cardiolipin synthase A/B
MSSNRETECEWLRTGEQALEQMLAAIAAATKSVRLEMYIVHAGPIADEFRTALVNARQRGLRVRVLVDAFGSAYLPDAFWNPLRERGGEFRWFNPIGLRRVFIRDHRKLLVCDDELAFIGGFNIATEYSGDGVTSGWCDLGLKVRGELAEELGAAFDAMYACADFKHKPFPRLRKSPRIKTVTVPQAKLFLGGPGRNNPIKRALLADLKTARAATIISPYFVPPLRIRRQLARMARAGAKVQLILPHKSDLPVMRLAGQSFYRRLLRAGVEIYEYQPQILHAKLFIIDSVAYAGSANLDVRSLNINYELLIRLTNPDIVREGRELFDQILGNSKKIDFAEWKKSRTFFRRLQARLAHFIMARLDTFFSRRQVRWWKLSLRKVREAKKHKPLEAEKKT